MCVILQRTASAPTRTFGLLMADARDALDCRLLVRDALASLAAGNSLGTLCCYDQPDAMLAASSNSHFDEW